LVVGKGFGGGIVPFAGIIGREGLNSLEHRSIGHYTHEKSPFCAAVAKAMIEYVESQHLVAYAASMGAYFKAGLEQLQSEFELIGNVSGLGMNLAVDLVLDRKSKARASDQAQALMNFCMNRGISFKLIQGNILNLKPSLVVTQGEVDYVLETLRAGMV
jgi:4-aminobutyrate aminotransferase